MSLIVRLVKIEGVKFELKCSVIRMRLKGTVVWLFQCFSYTVLNSLPDKHRSPAYDFDSFRQFT